MKLSIQVFLVFAVVFQIHAYAQQNDFTHKDVYPGGLNIDYGAGHLAVQDDFFSSEKYSGSLPYFKVGWSRLHGNRAFELSLKYGRASQIKNHALATNVMHFSLEWNYLYPVRTFSLFSKKVYAYLGPYAEFYTYYNRLNFANDGIFLDFSFATFFSLGVHPMCIMPLGKKFQFESSLQMNVCSVVIRMPEIIVEDDAEDESRLKLLTPFSGLNSQINVGMRYYLLEALSLKLRYELHLTRITTWEYLLAANDNAILTICYHF